ncbi:MAG: hypothetical protein FWE68_06355, partial [Defluviitaleaceae bacterium]|nr:hypothetical protein [Defluviitaleaceae bacterium]
MASYKISYKILRQQGEDMKSAAKLVDGYTERLSQIRGRLGDDNMLAEVRSNLQKLGVQLGESRAILNTAGEFLVKTVDSYSGAEVRQVKKVDATKAHNRDFYKNPVVVASVGGAAGGAAVAGAAGAAPPPAATTVNYTDNSVNVSYASVGTTPPAAAPDVQPAAQAVSAQPTAAAAAMAPTVGTVPKISIPKGLGVAAAAVGGAAVGAGGAA